MEVVMLGTGQTESSKELLSYPEQFAGHTVKTRVA